MADAIDRKLTFLLRVPIFRCVACNATREPGADHIAALRRSGPGLDGDFIVPGWTVHMLPKLGTRPAGPARLCPACSGSAILFARDAARKAAAVPDPDTTEPPKPEPATADAPATPADATAEAPVETPAAVAEAPTEPPADPLPSPGDPLIGGDGNLS